MTETQSFRPLQKFIVYRKALQLLVLVRGLRLRDCELRRQALRSVQSVCLNIAEAVGRSGAADRARVFAIARGEVTELGAALEIAGIVEGHDVGVGLELACEIHAMLSALMR